MLVHRLAGRQTHLPQQFLHLLAARLNKTACNFSPGFNDNEVGTTEFQYHNRDLMDLTKLERAQKTTSR